MINIRPHRTDHVRQTSRLGEIADNLAALDTHIVILINKQRFNHHKNTMDVGPHKLIEFVQNTVNDLDKQVAFLVFERALHQKRQDLVEQGTRSKRACLLRNLPQGLLSKLRRAIFDFQEQAHDLAFPSLSTRDALLFIVFLENLAKVLLVLRLHKRQLTDTWYIRWQIRHNVVRHGTKCR